MRVINVGTLTVMLVKLSFSTPSPLQCWVFTIPHTLHKYILFSTYIFQHCLGGREEVNGCSKSRKKHTVQLKKGRKGNLVIPLAYHALHSAKIYTVKRYQDESTCCAVPDISAGKGCPCCDIWGPALKTGNEDKWAADKSWSGLCKTMVCIVTVTAYW